MKSFLWRWMVLVSVLSGLVRNTVCFLHAVWGTIFSVLFIWSERCHEVFKHVLTDSAFYTCACFHFPVSPSTVLHMYLSVLDLFYSSQTVLTLPLRLRSSLWMHFLLGGEMGSRNGVCRGGIQRVWLCGCWCTLDLPVPCSQEVMAQWYISYIN